MLCMVHVSVTVRILLLSTNLTRILCNVLYCAKVNRDKQNGKYDQYEGYNDDRNPNFKMVL